MARRQTECRSVGSWLLFISIGTIHLFCPPSSGKATLVLVLARKLGRGLKTEGAVTYDGHTFGYYLPLVRCQRCGTRDCSLMSFIFWWCGGFILHWNKGCLNWNSVAHDFEKVELKSDEVMKCSFSSDEFDIGVRQSLQIPLLAGLQLLHRKSTGKCWETSFVPILSLCFFSGSHGVLSLPMWFLLNATGLKRKVVGKERRRETRVHGQLSDYLLRQTNVLERLAVCISYLCLSPGLVLGELVRYCCLSHSEVYGKGCNR